MKKILKQAIGPFPGVIKLFLITGILAFVAGCDGGGGGASAPATPVYDVDAKGVPKFVNVDYIELSKIKTISRFRSSAGHDYSDDDEDCRSMKHYFNWQGMVPEPDPAAIKIYAPVDGTISRVVPEWAGTQIWISSKDYPAFSIIIFHINFAVPPRVGDVVTAGQELGTHIGSQTWSDIAIGVYAPNGGGNLAKWKLVSYFDAITDTVFQNYLSRGVSTRESIIISKAERDADPLTCVGETFMNIGTLESWVTLN